MNAEVKPVVDQTKSTDSNNPNDTWVSPEVAAAQEGERVEFGKTVEIESQKED